MTSKERVETHTLLLHSGAGGANCAVENGVSPDAFQALSLSLPPKSASPFFPSHPKKEEEAPLFKAKLEIKNLKMFLETDHLFNLIINFIIKINVTKHVYLNMNLKVR